MNFCVECGCNLNGEKFNCRSCGASVYGTFSKWQAYKNAAGYWCWLMVFGTYSELQTVDAAPLEYETEILTVIRPALKFQTDKNFGRFMVLVVYGFVLAGGVIFVINLV